MFVRGLRVSYTSPQNLLQGGITNYHVQQQHLYMYSKQLVFFFFAYTDNLTFQPSLRRLRWSLTIDNVSELDTVIAKTLVGGSGFINHDYVLEFHTKG